MDKQLADKATGIARVSGLSYLILQILDIYTTYRITPDLHREMNIFVVRFDLGWEFIILSALVATLIMFAAQFWVWKTLVSKFPVETERYGQFYRHLFYTHVSNSKNLQHDMKSIIAGILMILLYGLIAAKFLVVIWNASLLFFVLAVEDFKLLMLIKNLLAGLFGLFMFFVYLFRLHRS